MTTDYYHELHLTDKESPMQDVILLKSIKILYKSLSIFLNDVTNNDDFTDLFFIIFYYFLFYSFQFNSFRFLLLWSFLFTFTSDGPRTDRHDHATLDGRTLLMNKRYFSSDLLSTASRWILKTRIFAHLHPRQYQQSQHLTSAVTFDIANSVGDAVNWDVSARPIIFITSAMY